MGAKSRVSSSRRFAGYLSVVSILAGLALNGCSAAWMNTNPMLDRWNWDHEYIVYISKAPPHQPENSVRYWGETK